MDKLTITIAPEDWGNLVTKYRPHSKKLTQADFSDGTVNVDTDVNGSLTKRAGNLDYNGTLLSAAPKDQFEAIFSDGTRHLLVVQSGEIKYSSGDTIFNTIVNGSGFSSTANFEFVTTQDRVYMGNGVTANQVYDRVASYGGVTYTVPRLKQMGVQAPSGAATVAVAAGGNVPVGAHTYKVTFVYYDSEESNGGPASAVATTTAGNQTVNLSSVPIGGYGVTARNIYRDDNDGLWLFVGTIANNTATTFSDTIAVSVTPTEIPTLHNTSPSSKFFSLWLDRIWTSGVSGDPYTLFYSEAAQPDIFFPENQLLCNQEDPIIATVIFYDRLMVFNRKSFGQILGTTPDTFRYSAIPSTIGCVDNRSIQIRVIEDTPILIWLSDRGFYSYDGNSIEYISDWIEDLVNVNIQQALQQKNSNSQSSFTSGTSSDGIDTASLGSTVTTRGYLNGTSTPGNNPRRNWDDQADWEGALSLTNVATLDGSNTIKVPTRSAFSLAAGTLNGTVINGSNLEMSVATNFPGENSSTHGSIPARTFINQTLSGAVTDHGMAWPFKPSRAGTVTTISIGFTYDGFFSSGSKSLTYKIKVWGDGGSQPGTELFASANQTATSPSGPTNVSVTHINFTVNTPVPGNQIFWIGWQGVSRTNHTGSITTNQIGEFFPFLSAGIGAKLRDSSGWKTPTGTPISGSAATFPGYSYCTAAVSKSGQWLSAIYDTKSTSISPTLNIAHSGTFPSTSFCSGAASSSSVTRVEGSNSATFATIDVFEDVASLNGNQNISLSGRRYWRVRITLSTTDDRVTPSVTQPILKFSTTATWISETIDTTDDVVTYDSLTTGDSQPAGTSVAYKVATSDDDITYPDGFVTFGTEVVRQYIRVQAVLTSTTDNITTPSVSSIILRWTLTSNFISPSIDTGVAPPAGWDVFLSDFSDNGGTVQFQMRSATTLVGLSSATFFNVTPGDLPSAVTPLQFVQWKAIVTSSDNDVPAIESVTVQWFIAIVNSIRPASIFVDSRYYIALAEVGADHNDLLLSIDADGKWRRHSGLDISTFSYFFNRPYFGLATAGQIRRFLEGTTDAGDDIEFDYRSKALDFSTQYQDNSEKVKVVGEVILQGLNTGASYQLFYSVDEGQTFFNMVTNDGSITFTTTSAEDQFYVRFRPVWDSGNPISGRTIMYRVYNSDENEVQIDGLKATALLRRQSPVVTG